MRLPVGTAMDARLRLPKCPAMPSKPHPLAKSHARRIWLRAQRLDESRAVRRRARGDARRGGASRLRADRHHQRDRALPPPHPLHAHSRTTGASICARRRRVDKTVFEYWTHALSYVPTRDLRFFVGAMKRQRQRRSAWFSAVKKEDLRKVLTRIRKHGAADDPRHRRRRAGGEGPRLGEPQAVEAGAAARLLHAACVTVSRARPAC